MPVERPAAWQDLFVPGDVSKPGAVTRVNLVQRDGRPFLLLPRNAKAASVALSLYAAQTTRGRVAKSLLRLALKYKLPLFLPSFSLAIEHDEPFAMFLAKASGSGHFPQFAILPGNPNAPGSRFVILVFNDKNEPASVVKAGTGQTAAGLIEHESKFLASAPPGTPGIPVLRDALHTPRVHAFALDFIPGKSPHPESPIELERLLSAWIDTNWVATMHELPSWQRLTSVCGSQSPGWGLWNGLRDAVFHPVICNGDFAPWNIKETPDGWRVLDWERGEAAGVPCWDWFHFVVQHAVLVRREPVPALVALIEKLLVSEGFGRYAARAKVAGLEQKLLLAYLNYAINVLKQTEQSFRVQSLLDELAKAWA